MQSDYSTTNIAKARQSVWVTIGGRSMDLANPDFDDNLLQMIAHSLVRLPRWNGQTTRFYSVAEHSIRVAQALPEKHWAHALLHDAAEAVRSQAQKSLLDIERLHVLAVLLVPSQSLDEFPGLNPSLPMGWAGQQRCRLPFADSLGQPAKTPVEEGNNLAPAGVHVSVRRLRLKPGDDRFEQQHG